MNPTVEIRVGDTPLVNLDRRLPPEAVSVSCKQRHARGACASTASHTVRIRGHIAGALERPLRCPWRAGQHESTNVYAIAVAR